MMDYIASHGLDIFTTVLGLVYILLEYRASIWLWLVGIIMPALDVWLYWSHGLYGDAGMAVYYTIAGIYGYAVWKYGKKHNQKEKEELPITYMKKSLYLPTLLFFLAAWGITYYILITFTNSTVPLQDSFTNALSFVGLWALARKYIEQWFFWIIVDAVCFYLYIVKGIPFKAGLYGLYVIIAVAGYFKWKKMIKELIVNSSDIINGKGSQGKNKLARLPLFHLYKQEPLYQGSALKLILSAKSTSFMPFSPLIRFRY